MSISRFRTLSSFVAITPSHHDQLSFVPAARQASARLFSIIRASANPRPATRDGHWHGPSAPKKEHASPCTPGARGCSLTGEEAELDAMDTAEQPFLLLVVEAPAK